MRSIIWDFFTKRSATAPQPAPAKRTVTKTAVAVTTAMAIAIPFVASFEGYFSKAYRDPVGVLTICYGATKADGVDFSKTYTKSECEAMLGKDLVKYQTQVRKCVPQVQPPHREAALISFAYNLGPHALCGAVGRNINAGNIVAGCDAMLAYYHSRNDSATERGLKRRRQAERALCLHKDAKGQWD